MENKKCSKPPTSLFCDQISMDCVFFWIKHDWPHLLIEELCERIALDQNPKNSPQHVDHVMVNLTGSSYQTHLLVGYVPWGSPRSRPIRPWPWPTHTIVLRKKCVWKWNVIPKYSLKYRENIRSVSTRWKKLDLFPSKFWSMIFSYFVHPLLEVQLIDSIWQPPNLSAPCAWFHPSSWERSLLGATIFGLRPILSCDVRLRRSRRGFVKWG